MDRAPLITTIDQIEDAIYKLLNLIKEIDKNVKAMDTLKDTYSFRDQIKSQISEASRTIKHISSVLQNYQSDRRYSKLSQILRDIENNYNIISQNFITKDRTIIARPDQDTYYQQPDGYSQPPVDGNNGYTALTMNEIDTDRAIIDEKNKGIQQLRDDLLDLNEIAKDLAKIVGEATPILEEVQDTVADTRTEVAGAVRSLRDASELQKSANRKKIYICLACLVLLLLLGGIVVVILLAEKII
eukprot:TRINITY_DN15191_c0_g1_i1.p1 TRINITY_DN15191_c0_g1~~TRINITY_DN15191_c0_g1_i1.p1  ORF type:complete len:243 (-),score=38.41 TRINITY_DN15191_c0_g1_i1:18-746(-)